MGLREVLTPFTVWKHVFDEPVTIKNPIGRPAADRYRGFHQNDMATCIGCGTCEAICQNAAIDMVPVEGIEAQKGDFGLRPQIDYGRCCWCALCVDVCMTGSLTMSNEYTWVDTDPDAFRFVPGLEEPWKDDEEGYEREGKRVLSGIQRIHMDEMEPETRIGNFDEIVAGYTREEAVLEADRCVECGLCVATCPAHMSIPDYIAAVRDQDYDRGLQLLYETNPFSEVCGRVCTHKCETSCAALHEGDPIAIRWLKRHIIDEVPFERRLELIGKPAEPTGRKVAIIGAGPAGLTAAYDLARAGNGVVVFEALSHAGGMMRYGIPEYRLPYEALDRDIGVIEAMGVEIRTNTRVGRDVSMDELRRDYDAVILAIGLHMGRSTRVPGTEGPGVEKAVDLLRRITDGEEVPVPEQAVVIGGGNVAMDIARSMARLQKVKYGKVGITLTALEDIDHFLADAEEIVESREEGVEIYDARGPQEVVRDEAGNVTGLRTWHVKSIFDAEGRFAPAYDESDERVHAGTVVIEAIGQAADTALLGKALTEALEWNCGRIKIDAAFRTSEPWLFAAGDAVKGPDVINAVADGHRVAQTVMQELAAREVISMSEASKAKLSGKTTVRQIFETATEFEKVAHRFYTELIPNVSKDIRWLVEELAEEELEHVELFTNLAKNPEVEAVMAAEIARPVADGKFSDCVHTPDLGPNPDDQAVLQYALMRESAAMDQYTELAESAPDGPLKDAFVFLANEETKHKAELEKIYYEVVHSGGV